MSKDQSKSSKSPGSTSQRVMVRRVQSGMRLEKRLLKVLKALADYLDLSLGDLIEGICLHAFDGKLPFNEATQKKIGQLKQVYGLDLDSSASHRMSELTENEEPP